MIPIKQMIDARLIPESDHERLIEKLCKSRRPLGTIQSYTNSYRRGLGALLHTDPSLLDLPIEDRFSGSAAHIIVTSLEDRLQPIDTIKMAAQIRCVLEILTGENFPAFAQEIDRVRRAAKAAGVLVRTRRKRMGVQLSEDLPSVHRDLIEELKSGLRKDGSPILNDNGSPMAKSVVKKGVEEYLQFLGVMDRAGVAWQGMSPNDLINKESFQALAGAWCANGNGPERINTFVHILKKLHPSSDFSSASEVMAECRAKRPGSNAQKNILTNVLIDSIPLEDVERFAFACPEFAVKCGLTRYSPNEVEFEFAGECVELRRLPAKESVQEGFFFALRAMITVLYENAPEMVQTKVDKRDYDVIASLYFERYAKQESASLAARMESLLGLLRRILSSTVNLTMLEELTASARAKVKRKKVSAPNITEAELQSKAVAAMYRSYKRFKDLSVLNKPYMNPIDHLILARDSLILMYLPMEPLRRTCMTQLDNQDTGLIKVDDIAITHSQIDGTRMKNGRPRDYFGDPVVDACIDLYKKEIRQLIAPNYIGPALWVSSVNNRLSPSAIYKICLKTSMLIVGIEIRPHDFRRIIASNNIGNGLGTERLGHLGPQITRRYEDDVKRAMISRVSSLQGTGNKFWIGFDFNTISSGPVTESG